MRKPRGEGGRTVRAPLDTPYLLFYDWIYMPCKQNPREKRGRDRVRELGKNGERRAVETKQHSPNQACFARIINFNLGEVKHLP